jgi:hypothetical protein
MGETRKIAAILVADIVGYSRLAGTDEERTLSRLRGLRSDLIDPAIAAHRGRIVKRTGDGVLIEFRSVVDAVRCAIEVQNGMIERNSGLPVDRRIEFRVADQSRTRYSMADINITPTKPVSPPYRQIGDLGVCAWCGERSKCAYAIIDPPARAVFNIGNCGRAACAEGAAKSEPGWRCISASSI